MNLAGAFPDTVRLTLVNVNTIILTTVAGEGGTKMQAS